MSDASESVGISLQATGALPPRSSFSDSTYVLTHLRAGSYQGIVNVSVLFGSAFRTIPFVIGVGFLLFQKRSAILASSSSVFSCIIRFPQSAAASWRSFRGSDADTNPESDLIVRQGTHTGDGNLHIGSALRRPRISELSDAFIVPRVGSDFHSEETSMAEMKPSAYQS